MSISITFLGYLGQPQEDYVPKGDKDGDADDGVLIEAPIELEDKVEKVGGATFTFRSPKSD